MPNAIIKMAEARLITHYWRRNQNLCKRPDNSSVNDLSRHACRVVVSQNILLSFNTRASRAIPSSMSCGGELLKFKRIL